VTGFDPQAYWSDRLDRTYTLGGVGWLGLGEAFNEWMYRVRRRVFLRTARDVLGDSLADAHVLDVGSGTGFYVERWHELDAVEVSGADLTDVAVQRLRERFPGDEFTRFDLTAEPDGLPANHYDAISAMDVLFHIVDDAGYERAVVNVHSLLRPGGSLIFSENLIHDEWIRSEHQVVRDIDWTLALLDRAGFEVVRRRPLFVLMNTPVDSSNRLLERYWGLLMSGVRSGPRASAALGAVLYPVELGLTALLRESPTTEIVVARKRSS
jgi:SAM-dependent methyltransferase